MSDAAEELPDSPGTPIRGSSVRPGQSSGILVSAVEKARSQTWLSPFSKPHVALGASPRLATGYRPSVYQRVLQQSLGPALPGNQSFVEPVTLGNQSIDPATPEKHSRVHQATSSNGSSLGLVTPGKESSVDPVTTENQPKIRPVIPSNQSRVPVPQGNQSSEESVIPGQQSQSSCTVTKGKQATSKVATVKQSDRAPVSLPLPEQYERVNKEGTSLHSLKEEIIKPLLFQSYTSGVQYGLPEHGSFQSRSAGNSSGTRRDRVRNETDNLVLPRPVTKATEMHVGDLSKDDTDGLGHARTPVLESVPIAGTLYNQLRDVDEYQISSYTAVPRSSCKESRVSESQINPDDGQTFHGQTFKSRHVLFDMEDHLTSGYSTCSVSAGDRSRSSSYDACSSGSSFYQNLVSSSPQSSCGDDCSNSVRVSSSPRESSLCSEDYVVGAPSPVCTTCGSQARVESKVAQYGRDDTDLKFMVDTSRDENGSTHMPKSAFLSPVTVHRENDRNHSVRRSEEMNTGTSPWTKQSLFTAASGDTCTGTMGEIFKQENILPLLFYIQFSSYKQLMEQYRRDRHLYESLSGTLATQGKALACLLHTVLLLSARIRTQTDRSSALQATVASLQKTVEKSRRRQRVISLTLMVLVIVTMLNITPVRQQLLTWSRMFRLARIWKSLKRARQLAAENWRNVPGLLTNFWRIFIFRSRAY